MLKQDQQVADSTHCPKDGLRGRVGRGRCGRSLGGWNWGLRRDLGAVEWHVGIILIKHAEEAILDTGSLGPHWGWI